MSLPNALRPRPPGASRRAALHRAGQLMLATAWLATTGVSSAQTWPQKPLRLVVSFPPGGLADVMVRLMQQPLSDSLGQPVLIENRGGASGNLAADVVAKSTDGHSFLVTTSSIESVNPFMFSSMAFDPAKDLAHVALLANSRLYLVAHADLPADDLKSFVAHARANPGKLSYGSPGTGSTPHLAGEMFKQTAGFFAVHVPYRGIQPAIQDLLAGQIDVAFVPGTALTFVRSGKLKLLGVVSPARVQEAPVAPTFAEQGFGEVQVDSLFGVYAPSGTPPDVVERLNREINKQLALSSTRARFMDLGAEPLPTTPAAFKAAAQAETVRFAALIKARQIKAD